MPQGHVAHHPGLPETEWRRAGQERASISTVWSSVYDKDRVLSELDSRFSAPQGSMYRAIDGPNFISTVVTDLGSWTERWSLRESLERAMDVGEGRSEGTVSESSFAYVPSVSWGGGHPRGG